MTALSWPALTLLGLLAGLLLTAAVTDWRARIIGNRLNLAIALLALPWWLTLGLTGGAVFLQLGLALGVFAFFAACFAAGAMGGGDVKLLAALALWLPLGALAHLLVWMALGGGLLTLVMLVRHRLLRAEGPIEVPYGLAIVGAAFLVMANDILTTSVPVPVSGHDARTAKVASIR